jgi:galactose oxidase-like protein
MKLKFFLTVLIVFALIVPLTRYTRSASAEAAGVSPSARGYHQMTYDTESGLVIVYGGQTGNFFQDPIYLSHETWSFDPDSNVWTQMSPATSPGGSSGGEMTYDAKADRSILSVISDDFSRLETWAYDANADTWIQLADGPRVMVGQRIVYDSESDRIIMFGGFDFSNFKLVDDLWVYDYNTDTWTNMPQPRVHPSSRNFIGMVYDSKADRVVMWGDWQRNYTAATDESVWTYDFNTNTWQEFQHKKDGPMVRDYTMLAYDSKADRIIMYGGYDFGNDETWVYDLNTNTWQQKLPVNNPGIISRYGMVYVKDVNRTILFGGQDGAIHFQYKGDTWSYNLKTNRWTNINPGN